jgi:hypothetical protein
MNYGNLFLLSEVFMEYEDFLNAKSQLGYNYGFDPVFMPDFLFDFQKDLVQWSLKKGRSAIFADCGLGKSPMELVWAQNVVEKTYTDGARGRKV